MKSNELMIGDWVYQAQYEDKNVPQKGHGWKEVVVFRIPFDEEWALDPIPLTEEILEKNGFYKTVSGDLAFEEGIVIYERRGFFRGLFEISSKKFEEIPKDANEQYWYGYYDTKKAEGRYKYVHELQHALRLCGLNDLADNFKI